MVHFRNIVIHEYRKTHTGIVKSVIQNDCSELPVFAEKIRLFVLNCI
ncbi:MAG: HepT-like ribonuclease domain-containing protein [Desulfococcaceae bacterium]